MPQLDSTAVGFLDGAEVVRPAFFVWLDIEGEALRATTYHQDITISGHSDTELNGTYLAVNPSVVEIGEVSGREGGSDTLTIKLSALLITDSEVMNSIGDKSNWQGRTARLWFQLRDEDGEPQGAVASYYTGYMVAVGIETSPESQTISLKIENYLAAFAGASNRTYMSQKEYDSGDESAGATLGAANGARTGPAALIGTGNGSGNSGTYRKDFPLADKL